MQWIVLVEASAFSPLSPEGPKRAHDSVNHVTPGPFGAQGAHDFKGARRYVPGSKCVFVFSRNK